MTILSIDQCKFLSTKIKNSFISHDFKFKREMEMFNPYHFNITTVFLSQDYSRQMFQMFI